MRTLTCTHPDCPRTASRSPWESDEEVEQLSAGDGPGECTRLQILRSDLDFTYEALAVRRQVPDTRRHVLAVRTAPRPCGSSLGTTVASLGEGGALGRWLGNKVVVVDGLLSRREVDEYRLEWELFASGTKMGSALSLVETLRTALGACPDLEHVTLVEDDVEVCRGFLDYVPTVAVPDDVAFVSWFTYDYDWAWPRRPYQCADLAGLGRPVLASRTSRFFVLSQAVTLPRRTVDCVLRCPMVAEGWPTLDGADRMLSWALGDARYAVHFPILVQHAGGDNSAVALARGPLPEGADDPQAGDRKSPHYVGRDFDAGSLIG